MATLPNNSVALYRICTEKSVLGFGKYRDLTVGDILCLDPSYIGYVYYNCQKISFHKDILEAMKLTPIEKPGADKEAFAAWKKENNYDNLPFTPEQTQHYRFIKARAEKRRAKARLAREEEMEERYCKKGRLQAKNHGHF